MYGPTNKKDAISQLIASCQIKGIEITRKELSGYSLDALRTAWWAFYNNAFPRLISQILQNRRQGSQH